VFFWIWYESDVASDDIFATANYGPDGHQLASYTFDPTLWSINDLWTNAYITINKANIVLDRVPPIVMDVTQRNRVLGEAHYLRALAYFQLVRMFGDVPLMEHEAKSIADAKIARTPAAQVYALIVGHLQTFERSSPSSARTWPRRFLRRDCSPRSISIRRTTAARRNARDR
jgi:hypothetical protein